MKRIPLLAVARCAPIILIGMLATGLPFAERAHASGRPPSVLHPYTRESRSGTYALHVNPSDWLGRGPADYRFTKQGVTVWSGTLDFTLWDCEIANSGHVAGYAYSLGEDGLSEQGYLAGCGTFSTIIMSPSGEAIHQETHARQRSKWSQRLPDPNCEGVFLVEPADRVVWWVADADWSRGIDQWWVYEMSSGKRVATAYPQTLMAAAAGKPCRTLMTAKAIPSTTYILTHGVIADDACGRGGVFMLVDAAGTPFWSLVLNGDYTFPDDPDRQEEVWEALWDTGGILNVTPDRTFDVPHVKAGQRVSFEIVPQPEGAWQVREIGRTPYVWPPKDEPRPVFECPEFPLRSAGTFALAGVPGRIPSPLRDLCAFDFDAEGRICALRYGAGETPAWVQLTQDGAVLSELPMRDIALPEGPVFAGPSHVGGRRFLTSVSTEKVGDTARFFMVDFATDQVRELCITNCPSVKKIAGFPDGRFVVLTYRNIKHEAMRGLFCFDREGREMWKREESGYGDQPDELLSPQDVTRYKGDSVAVLDNIRHTIQIYDRAGKFERVVDLRKAWGREPNYPVGLAADTDDGFLLYDFNARPNFLKLGADGAIRQAAVARLADGRPIAVEHRFVCSPGGDIWTSDGDALLRLAANGVADRLLGVASAQDILYEGSCATVGPDDRLYIADKKSHVVHVFDAAGKPVGRCIPDVADMTEYAHVTHIAVSPDRQVYVQMGGHKDGYAHFDEHFSRIGMVTNVFDPITETWCFQPSNHLAWVLGYNDVFLVQDRRSEGVRRISRRADGRWLEYLNSAAVAPDGSLAVASRSQSREVAISLYTAAGEPLTTFAVPLGMGIQRTMAYTGRHVLALTDDRMVVFASDGRVAGCMRLPQVEEGAEWSGPFCAAQGREIWLIELQSLKVFRWAAP
jgi:hypothetical protein